jgi:putative PIN family toxin of toxin-antitoxin system
MGQIPKRVVIDTGILISALIRPQGATAPVLAHLRAGKFTVIYVEALLVELINVAARPKIRVKYGVTNEDVLALLNLIRLRGAAAIPRRTIQACRDPKDDKFLEAAVAGKADAIVSGDGDLIDLHPFEGIEILSPADFLARFAPEETN